MATATFQEFASMAKDTNNETMPVVEGGTQLAKQTVSYTTSTQSATFQTKTTVIRLCFPQVAYWEVGSNPTATATSAYLPADTVEYVGVKGGSDKIAIYDGAS